MQATHYDLEPLRRALADRAAELATALLGEPTFRSRFDLRWGRRGSFSVAIAGPRRGLWFDHERGEGGDLFDLYRRVRGGTFAEAMHWARSTTGEPDAPPPRRDPPPPPERDTQALALELWRTAREAVEGTPAERYLRSRGIDPRRLPPHPNADPRTAEHDDYCYFVSRWPPGLRWHAERSALIVGINDATSGLVRAVQAISLRADGTPVVDANGKKVKRTLGSIRGRAARFAWRPGYEHGRWALAEGCETALAAAQMLGCPCWASLGASNMPHVKPPSWARFATIVADHDDAGLRAAELTARNLRRLGLKATVITPERDGADAADLAREMAHAE